MQRSRDNSQRSLLERLVSEEETEGTWPVNKEDETPLRQEEKRLRQIEAAERERGRGKEEGQTRLPAFARASASSLPGREQWLGTHWRLTETPAEEREKREDQREKRERERRTLEPEERKTIEERESERRRTEEKEQVER